MLRDVQQLSWFVKAIIWLLRSSVSRANPTHRRLDEAVFAAYGWMSDLPSRTVVLAARTVSDGYPSSMLRKDFREVTCAKFGAGKLRKVIS